MGLRYDDARIVKFFGSRSRLFGIIRKLMFVENLYYQNYFSFIFTVDFIFWFD